MPDARRLTTISRLRTLPVAPLGSLSVTMTSSGYVLVTLFATNREFSVFLAQSPRAQPVQGRAALLVRGAVDQQAQFRVLERQQDFEVDGDRTGGRMP